jgi:hypothetical protein
LGLAGCLHILALFKRWGSEMGSANDIKAARATYEGFIGLIKVSIPVITLIVAFVVFIIQ